MQLRKGFAALLAALLLLAPLVNANGADNDASDEDDAHAEDATDNSSQNETAELPDEGDQQDANETGDASDDHEGDGHDHADDHGDADDHAENATDRDDDALEDADDATDKDDDARERAEDARRGVKVETTDKRALFELEKEGAEDGEEEVKLDYDATEGVLKLEFSQESGDAESAFEYKVELERVVEYVDVNGNGAYDEENDTEIASHKVDEDMTWTVLGVEDLSADNKTGRKVTAEGTFHDVNGTMRIVFYAFGDFADLNGVSLRPTEVKFDIIFEGFAYQNESSALALELKVEYESEYEGTTNGTTLAASAGNVSGYFEWADWADVDGVHTPVLVTLLEDEQESEQDGESGEVKHEQKLYLSYARGTSIVHDPIMGVAYGDAGDSTSQSGSDTQDSGDTTTEPSGGSEDVDVQNDTPGPGIFAALAALGLAVAARRRK